MGERAHSLEQTRCYPRIQGKHDEGVVILSGRECQVRHVMACIMPMEVTSLYLEKFQESKYYDSFYTYNLVDSS